MTGSGQAPLLWALGGVFAAVLTAVLLTAGWRRDQREGRRLTDQVERYRTRQNRTADSWQGNMTASAVRVVTHVLRSSDTEHKLATRLDLAGIRRKPAEWILASAAAGLLLAIVVSTVTGSWAAGALAGTLAGGPGSRQLLTGLVGRRRAAFSDQLPEALVLVSGALQSGLTLTRALDRIVAQNLQPVAGEISRVLSDVQLGADLEETLDGVADRMDSDDLRWTVMAIHIQRSVGGNLVEVLNNVITAMRERAYLRRHVKALSAEGRISASILVALPILIGGWLFYASPAYMRPLYTTGFGITIFAGSFVLVGLGAVWMRRLIRLEV